MSSIQGRADVVIVGGGVIGSAAAWRLAERGRSVVLLEQFDPGHRHGASHGSSRIYRQAYDGEFYTGLAARALPLWRALEDTTDTPVLTLTGAVDHGLPAALAAKANALAALGIPHELLDPVEAGRRWPGIRFDTRVLYHPDAGRLHADRSVQALNRAAADAGADIRHGVAVHGIESTATGVEVVTDGKAIPAAHVVVAAGAWTRSLIADAQLDAVPELPRLRTTQEQPAHFLPLTADDWPSFVHHRGAGLTGEGIYGLGSDDGIKIGEHGTGPVVDPEMRDYTPDPAGVARLVDYAAAWLPGVDLDSVTADTCLYTTTPDSNFVVDRVGDVTVAAGFSGHGFKFAPVIGELVADLADGTTRTFEPFRFGARQAVAAR